MTGKMGQFAGKAGHFFLLCPLQWWKIDEKRGPLMPIFFLIAILTMAGCASATRHQDPPEEAQSSAAAPSGEERDESSKILNRNKCPKQSKIVNGKCTLSVESDE